MVRRPGRRLPHFGSVPEQVLLDNARALVDHHNAATHQVVFSERLVGFARNWGFRRWPVRRTAPVPRPYQGRG